MSEENKDKLSNNEIDERLEKLKLIESELEERASKVEKAESDLKKKLKLPPGNDVFSKLTELVTQSYTLYVSEKGNDDNLVDCIQKILEARKMVNN